MIPKTIHYCWFGRRKKPPLVRRCISSWEKFCPDFDIAEWNEDNCDIFSVPFAVEAYRAKKYAFVSDVIRLFVLEQYGGVYLDTDVEIVRDISPLMTDEGFIGFENDEYVASGLVFACVPHHPAVKEMLNAYHGLRFNDSDGEMNMLCCPRLNTDVLERFGLIRNGRGQLVGGIRVYPADYFNPMDSATGRITYTENTYTVHRYGMSWLPKRTRFRVRAANACRRIFGKQCFDRIKNNR